MKAGIHPEYKPARITCACGRVTETRSTVGEIHVEICSHCHPFFTGRQKLVDTAGRVERFFAKYGSGEGASARDGSEDGAETATATATEAAPAEEAAPPEEATPAEGAKASAGAAEAPPAEAESEDEAGERDAARES